MNFNDQDLQCFVTLSAAKGLSRWAERCFAALSMTVPVWIVKNHNRHSTAGFICQSTLSGPSARRLRRRSREKLGGHPQTPARGCAPGPRFWRHVVTHWLALPTGRLRRRRKKKRIFGGHPRAPAEGCGPLHSRFPKTYPCKIPGLRRLLKWCGDVCYNHAGAKDNGESQGEQVKWSEAQFASFGAFPTRSPNAIAAGFHCDREGFGASEAAEEEGYQESSEFVDALDRVALVETYASCCLCFRQSL